jgi:succinoglycan biosynthesis transport protein ExoP
MHKTNEPSSELSFGRFSVASMQGSIVRRRWWVISVASIIAVLTLAALSELPKAFTSVATLVVVEQQVPQRYVTPTSTTDMAQALEATTQEVLSRTRLLMIIDEFNLYPSDREHASPEELEAKIRKNIKIEPITTPAAQRDIDGFKISFTSGSPETAQIVNNRLTSLFIEQNLETREHQASVTTAFLHEQLAAAKTKLAAQEERVRDFKMANLGELPEQQSGNLAVLTGLQAQLQNTTAGLARAEQQHVYLQSLLNNYRVIAARGSLGQVSPVTGTATLSPLAQAKRDLRQLKAKRAELLNTYTPEHPEVIKLNSEIAQAEASIKTLRTENGGDGADSDQPGASTGSARASDAMDSDQSVAQIKSQLDANRLETENLLKDEQQIKAQIAQYQQRLNLTPVREQQLAGLQRDYDLLKQDYTDLLNKETQSQLASNLEKRQEGSQFRLVDKPSLPVVPSFPKPLPIGLGGLVFGLLAGLASAVLIDQKGGYFYSEKDLSQALRLPITVGVPYVVTLAEAGVRQRRRVMEWIAGTCIISLVMALELYELFLKRHG